MKTKSLFFLFIFILFFSTQQSNAGISLLQSFSEQNISGDTQFGWSVSGAGDVNKDNYDDVIIGAHKYNSNTGRAYIYYGGSAMDNSADVTLDGQGLINYFGHSVSGAGDVNDDNYDDVIVGAYRYNSSTGRAYVYYGGSAMDPNGNVVLDGEGAGIYFGYSVSGAGDVNNDTYADVIVGANGYNSNTGRAYIYYGGGAITPMDNTADVILDGQVAVDNFGYSVSGAGNVNNDDYDDVIVGAFGHDSWTGRAYIFYGNGGDMPMDNTADVTLDGENQGDYFARSVSGAGDVNNDNYADVIVGAESYNSSTGRAYIYYGGAAMNPNGNVILNGENQGDKFGNSVSAAGNVNNDDYGDVIVGANFHRCETGRAYIYFGGSPMNDVADVKMDGEGEDNDFGISVSSAGDVNKDDYADIIVGAAGYNCTTGRAYIYYGGAVLDNTADVTMTGEAVDDKFGASVSSAGDVNNDGYSDVIVGANKNSANGFSAGRAYIYYGGVAMNNTADVIMTGEAAFDEFGASVSTAGDVNNDGYSDVIVGAHLNDGGSWDKGRAYIFYGNGNGTQMDNTADVTMTGESDADYFGWSVSTAGDVNKDGYSDVIVGAYSNDNISGWDAGRAYIFYGGAGMDENADVTLDGETAGDQFGESVSNAGDVNKDGYGDVIVGANGYNNYTGRAYIYFGGSPMNSNADVLLNGENLSDEFGDCVSDAGDVNNDGYDDVIVNAEETGRVYIYYGGSPMNSVADVLLNSENPPEGYGFSVSGAGDVNKNGFDDVIIGAQYSPFNGKAYLYEDDIVTDTDGDGCPDITEGNGDRDGDGTLNKGDYDPTGYFFDEADGKIIPGGSISVTGPGAITIIHNGSSGYYQFFTDGTAGIYTIHVTLPPNYLWSTTCLDQGTLDPPANPNPYVLGNGEKGNSGYLTSNACTDFYLQFDLVATDPFIFNNNFPLANQAPTAIVLSSFYAEVGQDGILTCWTTETEPNNAGFNVYRSTEENGNYIKINDSLIPAQGDATTGASYSYVDKPEQSGDYFYKLQSVSLTGATSFHGPIFVGLTSVDLKKSAVPENYSLSQNYPNPFNPETTIEFGLPKAGFVEITIYDINGRLVRKLVSEQISAGNHIVKWNANDESGNRLTSGIYYYRMKVSDYQQTQKMILMK